MTVTHRTKQTSAFVGIVPRKQVWDIITNKNWYHIPVKNAPKNIERCKYIAFYFPKLFGVNKCYRVIYYTAIVGFEIVKRIELFPEEIKHIRANTNYYRLFLDELQELPKAIPSERQRRIIVIPTTLEKLFLAEEINDLFDTSPLEHIIYHRLKRANIDAERQVYVMAEDKAYCLDFAIYCREGNIDLECDGETYHNFPEAYSKDRTRNNELTSYGWSVLRFGTKDINHNLDDCLETILRTVNKLGGLTK